jgi:hypothetical protein
MRLLLTLVLLLVGLTVSGQDRELKTLTQIEDGKRHLVMQGRIHQGYWIKVDLKKKTLTTQDGEGIEVNKIIASSDDGSGILFHVIVVKYDKKGEDGKVHKGSNVILATHNKGDLSTIVLRYPQTDRSYLFIQKPKIKNPDKEELEELDADEELEEELEEELK